MSNPCRVHFDLIMLHPAPKRKPLILGRFGGRRYDLVPGSKYDLVPGSKFWGRGCDIVPGSVLSRWRWKTIFGIQFAGWVVYFAPVV